MAGSEHEWWERGWNISNRCEELCGGDTWKLTQPGSQKGVGTKGHTEAFPTCRTLAWAAPMGFGRKMQYSELVSLVLPKGPFCADVQQTLGNVNLELPREVSQSFGG